MRHFERFQAGIAGVKRASATHERKLLRIEMTRLADSLVEAGWVNAG